MKTINVNVKHKNYDIILERGSITHLHDYFDTKKKIFILTDENVPKQWVDLVSSQCENSMVYKVHGGEESKSMKTYQACLQACLAFHMSRKDLLIALGGGVIGDLGGFVAASYMRGIPFISIPTTTLSQIDSSIGGKVAINLGHVKNIVGAFYHPEKVIIDFDTLSTLPHRHFINGLLEALKAGLIHDPKLFALFEKTDWQEHLETIIYRSLQMKKWVVEEDEKEEHLRKTLNFGHTIGHGIEGYYNLEKYYHGECVAMGMLYFIEDENLKQRVLAIYEKMGVLATTDLDVNEVYKIVVMDKKAHDNKISVVKVKEVGKAYLEDIEKEEILTILKRGAL
ncbi:MAG: 3-dehydroquinate synthase [Erysipelotrichia bacterium]|nr:3-dehydroquinate synthase [Erysipelotrichia bacterium]NCC54338.1 3-dehydroquinate synthase [Erysipelotrichia bacterium]